MNSLYLGYMFSHIDYIKERVYKRSKCNGGFLDGIEYNKGGSNKDLKKQIICSIIHIKIYIYSLCK